MIVKLDHITYVASRKQIDENKINYKSIKFQEKHLRNPKGKQVLMYNKCIDSDLIYIEDSMPVEMVLYDEVIEKTDIHVRDNTIYCYCRVGSFDEIDSLFQAIGFRFFEQKNKESIYKINGVFDKRELFLNIREKYDIKQPFLDREGWDCPCFLVDSVEKLFKKISGEKCICTLIDKLVINNRELEIGFLKNDNMSLILEFIAPMKYI